MALAAELTRLQEEKGTLVSGRQSTLPSLLFSREEAASIPLADLASLGANGFTQLRPLLPVHLAKSSTISQLLFSGSIVDRKTLSPAAEAKVHQAIIQFLTLGLSSHLPRRPAVKCLEWLLQGWNLVDHLDETKTLLLVAMPLHAVIPFFPRLLRALGFGVSTRVDRMSPDIKRMFAFLSPFADTNNNIPLSRDAIESQAPWQLLLEIGRIARRAGVSDGARLPVPTATFYAALVAERIMSMAANRSVAVAQREMLTAVVAEAIEGLAIKRKSEEDVFAEYRAACLAILMTLGVAEAGSGRLGLLGGNSDNLVFAAAAEVLAKRISETTTGCPEMVTCIVAVASCQDQLPASAVNFLAKVTGFLGQQLSILVQSDVLGEAARRFVHTYSKHAAEQAPIHLNYTTSLADWLVSAPLGSTPDLAATTLYLTLKNFNDPSQQFESDDPRAAKLSQIFDIATLPAHQVQRSLTMFLEDGGSVEWARQFSNITRSGHEQDTNLPDHPEAKIRMSGYRKIFSADLDNFPGGKLTPLLLRCLRDPDKETANLVLSVDRAFQDLDLDSLLYSLGKDSSFQNTTVCSFILESMQRQPKKRESEVGLHLAILLHCLRPDVQYEERLECCRCLKAGEFDGVASRCLPFNDVQIDSVKSSEDLQNALLQFFLCVGTSSLDQKRLTIDAVKILVRNVPEESIVGWALIILKQLFDFVDCTQSMDCTWPDGIFVAVITEIMGWTRVTERKEFGPALASILNSYQHETAEEKTHDQQRMICKALEPLLDMVQTDELLMGTVSQVPWLQSESWLWTICVTPDARAQVKSRALQLLGAFAVHSGRPSSRHIALLIHFASAQSHPERRSACVCIGAFWKHIQYFGESERDSCFVIVQFLSRRLDDIERSGCLSLASSADCLVQSMECIIDEVIDEDSVEVKRSMVRFAGLCGRRTSRLSSTTFDLAICQFKVSGEDQDMAIVFQQMSPEVQITKQGEVFDLAIECIRTCNADRPNSRTLDAVSGILRILVQLDYQSKERFLSHLLEKCTSSAGNELRAALGETIHQNPELLARFTDKAIEATEAEDTLSLKPRIRALECLLLADNSTITDASTMVRHLLEILKLNSNSDSVYDSDSFILLKLQNMLSRDDCNTRLQVFQVCKNLISAGRARSNGSDCVAHKGLKGREFFRVVKKLADYVTLDNEKDKLSREVLAVCEVFELSPNCDTPIPEVLDLLSLFRNEIHKSTAAHLFLQNLIARVIPKVTEVLYQGGKSDFFAVKDFYKSMIEMHPRHTAWDFISQLEVHIDRGLEPHLLKWYDDGTSLPIFRLLSHNETLRLLSCLGLGDGPTLENALAKPILGRMQVICSELQRTELCKTLAITSSKKLAVSLTRALVRNLRDVELLNNQHFSHDRSQNLTIYKKALGLLDIALLSIPLACVWQAIKNEIGLDEGAALDIMIVKLRVMRFQERQQVTSLLMNDLVSGLIRQWNEKNKLSQRFFVMVELLVTRGMGSKLSNQTWEILLDNISGMTLSVSEENPEHTHVSSGLLCLATCIRVVPNLPNMPLAYEFCTNLFKFDCNCWKFKVHLDSYYRLILAFLEAAPQYLVGEELETVVTILIVWSPSDERARILLRKLAKSCSPRLTLPALSRTEFQKRGISMSSPVSPIEAFVRAQLYAARVLVEEMSAKDMRDHYEAIESLLNQFIWGAFHVFVEREAAHRGKPSPRRQQMANRRLEMENELMGIVVAVAMQLSEKSFRGFLVFLVGKMNIKTDRMLQISIQHPISRMVKKLCITFRELLCPHFRSVVLPVFADSLSTFYSYLLSSRDSKVEVKEGVVNSPEKRKAACHPKSALLIERVSEDCVGEIAFQEEGVPRSSEDNGVEYIVHNMYTKVVFEHYGVQIECISLYLEHAGSEMSNDEFGSVVNVMLDSFGTVCLGVAAQVEGMDGVLTSWLSGISHLGALTASPEATDREESRKRLCQLARMVLTIPPKLSKRCRRFAKHSLSRPGSEPGPTPLALGLQSMTAMAIRVGHDFLCTLPETMQTLASAISDPKLERDARDLTSQFEALSGEPLLAQLAA